MKKRMVAIFLIFTFLFVMSTETFARGRSGGFSGGSSRSFGGYSGSSKSYSGSSSGSGYSSKSSKSSGGYSGSSSSSGYSGSSSSSSSSRTWGGTAASKSSAKNTYMQDYYKKESSKRSYNTYKQTLNPAQKSVYDSSMNKNYDIKNKMNIEDAMRTRPSRISTYEKARPIYMNVNNSMFGRPLSYGSAFVGIWDMWFLMRASEMFWYNHWSEISPYKSNFDSAQITKMEARIKELEQKNIVKNPNYVEPGVDPDLQFSNNYQDKNPSALYNTSTYKPSIFGTIFKVFLIIIIILILLLVLKRFMRRKKAEVSSGSYSRIY